MKLAVFVPNWVGDAVMATPALRAIRKRFSHDVIVGIMRPGPDAVLAGSSWFDERWVYGPSSRFEIVRRMRAARFDLSLLLPNSFGTALMAFLGGGTQRIGYDRDGRGFLLTRRLFALRDGWKLLPCPAVDSYLDLAYAVGCPRESPRTELETLDEDERRADMVWTAAGLKEGERVVVCNSSGAFGAAKLWPDEYFVEAARRIAGDLGHHVLFLCGPAERDRIESLTHRVNHPRVTSLAPYPLSLGLSKACVRRASLLISTDSGPRHFGAAFGVPVLALFGPTHMAWSDTHYEGEVRLQREIECGPCQQRICPLNHHRCMRELTVDTVLEHASALLRGGMSMFRSEFYQRNTIQAVAAASIPPKSSPFHP
jgi:heptosyltransferase-2